MSALLGEGKEWGEGGGGGGSGRNALVLVPNYYGLVRVLPISTPRALHQSL